MRIFLITALLLGALMLGWGGWSYWGVRGGPVSVATYAEAPPEPPVGRSRVVWAVARHADPPTPPASAANAATEPQDVAFGIIGGAPSPFAADSPGQVTLRSRSFRGDAVVTRSCEGTLIDRHWILTAHHCVDDPYVRTDVYGQGWSGYSFQAWGHTGYTRAGSPGDLALIRLEAPAPALAKTARMATEQEVAALNPGGRMQARGRGTTTVDANGPDNTIGPYDPLRSASVILTSRGPYLLKVMPANGGPCTGDSGGALVDPTNPSVIYGILSGVSPNASGQLCTSDAPAWYASAIGIQQWMDGVRMAHRQGQLPGP